MELNRRNIKIVAAITAGAIAFHWVLQNIVIAGSVFNTVLGLLAPFVFGLIIAFILNVPMRAIERMLFSRFKAKGERKFLLKLCRPISFALTLLILAAVLALVMFIVIPEIGRTFQTLSVGFPAFVDRVQAWADSTAKRIPEFAAGLPEITLNWDKIGETAFNFLQSGATSILSSTMGIATSVFSGIFNFFLGTIFAFYILFQKERLARQSKKLLYAYLPERKADSVVEVCVLSNRVFSKFISGQCLEACILGLLFFVSMSIFRFPYAMMISVLIAFTALIPVFGAFIGCVVGAFLILVSNPVQAFWFIVLFLILQQIEGNLIYPRVVGSSVGLPAMWVMLAVLLGGSAMGMFGMLVSVPLCSVIYTLLKTAANRRLKEKGTPEEKYQAGLNREGSLALERIWRVLFHRVTVIVLLILVQIAALVFAVLKFDEDFVYFYGFCFALSIVAVLCIINNKSNPAYKIAWIIPILALPIFGGMFYLFFNGDKLWFRRKKRMEEINRDFIAGMDLNNGVLEEIASQDSKAGNQSRYIEKFAQCPPYRNTVTEYLPSGEVKFKFLLEELRKAKRYIFLEYFIIEEGKMWNSVLHILQEKAKRGVEVRVIYDDMGSLMTLPANYKAKLEDLGIKCCVFNPFIPVLSLQFNNRDHRKICVIDGVAGFMGGINLADEYINARKKHGHWKDTAILLKGDAVWSLVVMFLSMWGYVNKTREDYGKFRPREIPDLPTEQSAGYVQPYTDSPLDDEAVGETVYLNLINKAERYVYINTPYLILSNEMITALSAAAKGGVDVRIVTPHIGDKWFVHSVTRAYYGPLVEAGVKIYEYTPGFIHAKSFVVDGEYGVVGSINLDYRSLYLHFESAVWLYRTNSIVQILEDYQKCLELCEEVTLQDVRGVKWYRRLTRSVLRVFAPLM